MNSTPITCPTCRSLDPKIRRLLGIGGDLDSRDDDYCRDPWHGTPADEIREASHLLAGDALAADGAEYGGHGAVGTRWRDAVALVVTLPSFALIEAALSRDTDHDHLMRDVVEEANCVRNPSAALSAGRDRTSRIEAAKAALYDHISKQSDRRWAK